MISSNDKKTSIIRLVPIIFCFIVGYILACDSNCPDRFKDLWLLPATYGIILFVVLVSMGTILDDLIFVIITFGYFIKCVLGPLLLRYGSYSSMFEDTNRKEMDLAILLLLCEIVAIYIFIIRQKNKLGKFKSISKKERNVNDNSGYNTSLFKLTVTLLTIATLLIVISHPYYLNEYSSIFSQNFRITDHPETSPLFTIFSCVFPMSYLTLAVLILSKINKIIRNSYVRFVLNILIFIVPLLFMNNSDGFNIISLICLVVYSYKTKGLTRKQLIFTMITASFVAFYIFSYIADNGSTEFHFSGIEKASRMCQAYFTGITNISGVFHMRNYRISQNLFYDLYYTIPFRNTLFGISGDHRTVIDYIMDNNAQSQIIPCIGQLFHYFSWLSPIVECVFIKSAYRNYKLCEIENNCCLYYIRLMNTFYLVLTPIMYNPTIYLSRYFVTILPMLFLYKYASAHNIK